MDGEKPKPITSKTGSKNFVKELQTRKFLDAHSILLEMKGKDVTEDFLQQNGFKTPILVRETAELGIKIPPVTDLNVLLKFLVPDLKDVDVIDVEKQDSFKMSVMEYFKYIMSPVKTRVLNLISMEVSKTRLSEFIEPPKIVRDIDWVHCYWNRTKEGHKVYVPSATEKYCLISPSNSFTDFHVDFSGTSVWYHIVTGVKDFYLVRPSSVNNHLFWKWSSSFHKVAQFFGDQVDECYKLSIHAGETLLLPTGWIHAVFTPVDSLVYGGNFLNTYNVEEQFAVYEMEMKEKVVEKYIYPHFKELNWFAAEGMCKKIDTLLQTTDILSTPCHLINAIKVSLPNLKAWSAKLSVQEKSLYGSEQLFKDMTRILRLHEKAVAVRNTEKRESTRVKKRPHSDDFILYDDFKIKKAQREQMESRGNSASGFPVQDNEEDSSSDSWKVKTDANKMLSVIIKRCSSNDPSEKLVSSGALSDKSSDSLCHPTIDVTPKKLNTPIQTDRPRYMIANPLQTTKYESDDETPTKPHSRITLCIKSGKTSPSKSSLSVHNKTAGPSARRNGNEDAQAEPSDDPLTRSVHQDEDYIYPALDSSEDDEPTRHSTGYAQDEAWSPSSKSISVIPKSDRPQRVGKTKVAVEKGLEAAALKPSTPCVVLATNFPPRKFIPPKKMVLQRPKPKPSTSSPLPSKEKMKTPPQKKGTAKQRLGKILKIHRMRR